MGTAIITGASTGIGAALAKELARRGHRVGLMARSADKLQQLADQIRSAGGTVAVAAADVTDRTTLERAVRELEAALGPCDLLVANAGGDVRSRPQDVRIDDWLAVMRLNFDGVVNTLGAVLPGMLQRGGGHIAAVSSLAAGRGFPGVGPYSASKAAVTTLFESLRLDLKRHGIAVSIIHPGYVATPLTAPNKFPMPFLMSAERAAQIIAHGLERRQRRIDFPWVTAAVMRLVRWLPDPIYDWAVSRFAPPLYD